MPRAAVPGEPEQQTGIVRVQSEEGKCAAAAAAAAVAVGGGIGVRACVEGHAGSGGSEGGGNTQCVCSTRTVPFNLMLFSSC